MSTLKLKNRLPLLFVAFALVCVTYTPSTAKAEALSPENVAGAETIDVKKAKELFDTGVLFIDSRSKTAFDSGRIPGAENVPLSKEPTPADFETVKESLEKLSSDKEKPVIMYCNGLKCPLSATMATKAIEWGYKKVYYFRGGLPAWKEAGYTVE